MKLKLNELNPNPFKKDINEGKLSEEQLDKIISNLGELGLMNSIPIVQRNTKYYLVNGHHRIEALKRKYGKDFEIDVTLHKYNDDQLLRGMIVENLTQRGTAYREEMENVVLIEKYLNENNNILFNLRTVRNLKSNFMKGKIKNKTTAEDIAFWLNKEGKIMTHDKITRYLNIYHGLSKDLQEKIIDLKQVPEEERPDTVSLTQASALSSIKNKIEQKAIFEKISEIKDLNVRSKVDLINTYKNLQEETKQEVLKGQVHLQDLQKVEQDPQTSREMSFTFNKKATDLILEMRTLRKTLYQFRKDSLFDNFTPKQRFSFKERLTNVKGEYGELIQELEKSIGVL